jgi:ATP-dependent DNA helicase HFM1/MER3
MFLNGDLNVLLSTTTLSQGVNLPAHLVIVKGTQYYLRQNGYVEYEPSIVLQMIGRAGRPQFDDSGVAIILTKTQQISAYENLISGQSPIESNMIGNFTEHLNAEISIGLVNSLKGATAWLRSTFFFIRVQKNPRKYGMQNASNLSNDLEKLLQDEISKLEAHGMITKTDEGSSSILIPKELGKLMAKHAVHFETASFFNYSQDFKSQEEILTLLSKSHEYVSSLIRMGEKKSK